LRSRLHDPLRLVFSGYRWPAYVILMAVRWYLRHPLAATGVMELLAERGIDAAPGTPG
jgi:transposase-like protein